MGKRQVKLRIFYIFFLIFILWLYITNPQFVDKYVDNF